MPEVPAIRIARGSTYLFTSNIAATLVQVAIFPFMARLLTMEEMGAVTALIIASTLSAMLSDIGFSNGVSKYIAEYRGKGADSAHLALTGLTSRFALAFPISLAIFMFSPKISLLLLKSVDYADVFKLLSINIFFWCINGTLGSILHGLNRIRDMAILGAVKSTASGASVVIFLLTGFGLRGLVLGWLTAELVGLIVVNIMLRKNLRLHSSIEFRSNFKTLAKFSWPLFILGLVGFSYGSVDQIVLLAYMPLSELAIYRVSITAASFIAIALSPIGASLFPYYSEKYGEGDYKSLSVGVKASSRYVALAYTPIALGLAIMANPALSLLASERYAGGDVILAILCIFGALTSIGAAFGGLLFIFNRTKEVLLINLLSIALSLLLIPLLLPSLGIVGMAVIKGIASLASFAATLIAINKIFKIEMDLEAFKKAWISGAVMALTVFAAENVWFSKFLIPLYMVIGALTYLAALKLLKAVDDSDLNLIELFLGEKLKFLVKPLRYIFP